MLSVGVLFSSIYDLKFLSYTVDEIFTVIQLCLLTCCTFVLPYCTCTIMQTVKGHRPQATRGNQQPSHSSPPLTPTCLEEFFFYTRCHGEGLLQAANPTDPMQVEKVWDSRFSIFTATVISLLNNIV